MSDLLSLDNPVWQELSGGYRIPYDASIALRALSRGDEPDAVWEELWNELHHQGDVGEASYASIPVLVEVCQARGIADWQFMSFVGTIEICRDNDRNPRVPLWLNPRYNAAWDEIYSVAIGHLEVSADQLTFQLAMAAIAIYRNQRKLGRLLLEFGPTEINELYDRFYGLN